MIRPDSIAKGRDLVDGDRHAQYGDSRSMMSNVAQAWSGILATPITPKDVALCMVALKLVREAYRADPDNLTDAAGYLLIAERLERTDPTPTAAPPATTE